MPTTVNQDASRYIRPFRRFDFSQNSYIEKGDSATTTGVIDILYNNNTIYGSKDYCFARTCTKGITNTVVPATDTVLYFNSFYMPNLPARPTMTCTVEILATANFTLSLTGPGGTTNAAIVATGTRQTATVEITSTNIVLGDINDVILYIKKTTAGTFSATVYNVKYELKQAAVDLSTGAYLLDGSVPQATLQGSEFYGMPIAMIREVRRNNLIMHHEMPRIMGTRYGLFDALAPATTAKAATALASTNKWNVIDKLLYFRKDGTTNHVDVWLSGFTDTWGSGPGARIKLQFDGTDQYLEVYLPTATPPTTNASFQLAGASLPIPAGPGPHSFTIYGRAASDTDKVGYIWTMSIRESVTWPIL